MKSPSPVNRLAIVLQSASTGGWRYTLRLAEGMRQARPHCELTVYLGRAVNKVCGDQLPAEVLAKLSIQVKKITWLRPCRNRSRLRNLVSMIRSVLNAPNYRRWIRELNDYDAVFFAWPYGIDCPACTSPVAFIPHDFNYTHFTGTFVESIESSELLRIQHQRWVQQAYPIVSTQFIADELKRTFPSHKHSPKVIPLSHLGSLDAFSLHEAQQIVRGLGIAGDYILSLNNVSAHKNLGQLLAGFHYVSKLHPELKLVLAGFGTEGIHGYANSPFYIDCSRGEGNVTSLGLRQDREVAALIVCAKMVVNASLYEAGNGSGLDAWAAGTPVAMSAIPAFLEHLESLDVRAETFNPRCCYELRDAMLRIIEQPETASINSAYSKVSMGRYRWKDVAIKYFQCFDDLAGRSKDSRIVSNA
jgi:glycosyltransferase involved in cell wall biosynthesis